MTNQHPITPPPELVQQWLGTYFGTTVTGEVSKLELALATQAAQWGADQELEACCDWVSWWRCMVGGNRPEVGLRAFRRPKPPTLKEQALAEVASAVAGGNITPEQGAIIRLALEAFPE